MVWNSTIAIHWLLMHTLLVYMSIDLTSDTTISKEIVCLQITHLFTPNEFFFAILGTVETNSLLFSVDPFLQEKRGLSFSVVHHRVDMSLVRSFIEYVRHNC